MKNVLLVVLIAFGILACVIIGPVIAVLVKLLGGIIVMLLKPICIAVIAIGGTYALVKMIMRL